jgi:uncharacterized protein YdhG (YjbR/CyaY superfamily)
MDKVDTIDNYIKGFPPEVQNILEKIRETIRKNAPEASETIKYGIPTFVQNGNLVHFAGYKKHIGFYPSPSGIAAFTDETTIYHTGKGTLQFPMNKPIPYSLISKIVKFRVNENQNKQKSKIKKT